MSTLPNKSKFDKLINLELAPSIYLTPNQETEVLNQILGTQFLDHKSLRQFIFEKQFNLDTTSVVPTISLSTNITAQMNAHIDFTLELTTKEASGRVLLGIIIIEVAKALESISHIKLYIDYEWAIFETGRAGKDLATDLAILTTISVSKSLLVLCCVISSFFPQNGKKRPIITYKYKPQVPTSFIS